MRSFFDCVVVVVLSLLFFSALFTIITNHPSIHPTIRYPRFSQRNTYLTCVTGFDIAFLLVCFFVCTNACFAEFCFLFLRVCVCVVLLLFRSRFRYAFVARAFSSSVRSIDGIHVPFNSSDNIQFSHCHRSILSRYHQMRVRLHIEMYLFVIQVCVTFFFGQFILTSFFFFAIRFVDFCQSPITFSLLTLSHSACMPLLRFHSSVSLSLFHSLVSRYRALILSSSITQHISVEFSTAVPCTFAS